MPLKFVLQETLDREGITKYQVHKHAGLRPNTLTEICAGKVSRLSVTTLDAIINALNHLTGKTHGIESVMIYENPTDTE